MLEIKNCLYVHITLDRLDGNGKRYGIGTKNSKFSNAIVPYGSNDMG